MNFRALKKITLLIILVLSISFSGCVLFMFGGGHGSLQGYRYPITKDKLENAIMTVLKNNPTTYRNTSRPYTIDATNGKRDTIWNTYYNDSTNYLTVEIKNGKIQNEYIIRYYGDEEYWKTNESSEIFIAYAYDKNSNGGSAGLHSFRFKPALKHRLID